MDLLICLKRFLGEINESVILFFFVVCDKMWKEKDVLKNEFK